MQFVQAGQHRGDTGKGVSPLGQHTDCDTAASSALTPQDVAGCVTLSGHVLHGTEVPGTHKKQMKATRKPTPTSFLAR